eukprot:gene7193-biopygen2394
MRSNVILRGPTRSCASRDPTLLAISRPYISLWVRSEVRRRLRLPRQQLRAVRQRDRTLRHEKYDRSAGAAGTEVCVRWDVHRRHRLRRRVLNVYGWEVRAGLWRFMHCGCAVW